MNKNFDRENDPFRRQYNFITRDCLEDYGALYHVKTKLPDVNLYMFVKVFQFSKINQ